MHDTGSTTELEKYLRDIRHLFSKKYLTVLVEELIDEVKKDSQDFDYLNILGTTFINESLENRVGYQFLVDIVDLYCNNGCAALPDIYSLIKYLSDEDGKDNENIQMFIPIKNSTIEELAFIAKLGQRIDYLPDKNQEMKPHFKIYKNTKDYYKFVQEDLIRISSLINIIRFYQGSSMDYDYENNVSVIMAKLGREFTVPLKKTYEVRIFHK